MTTEKTRRRRPWVAFLLSLVVAGLGFLGLFGLFFVGGYQSDLPMHAFHIPSPSMMPTLLPGDYILALTDQSLSGGIGPCQLVIFRQPPQYPGDSSEKIYVKRVVALSGDTVGYASGRLKLDGVTVPRKTVAQEADGATIYRETLPSGCSYLIRQVSSIAAYDPLDNVPDITVPSGAFYVLGDNRDDSADSRLSSIGPIPLTNYLGRAIVIYWARDLRRIGTWLY